MLTILYGADTYRSRERLHELVDAFSRDRDPSGMGLTRLDGTEASLAEIASAVRSQAFFGTGARMVTVERLLGRKHDEDDLLALLAGVPDDADLVLWEDLDAAAAAKHAVMKKLGKKKGVTLLGFDPLTGPSLTGWIRDEVARRGAQIEPRAVAFLVDQVGGDLWRLHGELEKLIAYRRGEPVRLADAELLTQGTVDEDIFGIMDALSAKDAARASRMIREQVAGGLEEGYLLAMLLRQARILTMARSYASQNPRATKDDFARALSLHPFVAQKAAAAASSFAPKTLLGLLDALFAADRAMKTGRVSPAVAVSQVVAAMA